jgi:prolyl-tRNA synthetase
MGCYGIGVTRTVGAAIEQNYDDKGIIWPRAIAPFEVVICPVGWGKSEAVREAATGLYQQLLAQGIDVLLDDRDERPGVMFADWELIGVPLRVTVGDRGLKNQEIELTARRDGVTSVVALAGATASIGSHLAELASR